MDTAPLIRSALQSLLAVADDELGAMLSSGDDYASSAKPRIDWDAGDALIDNRARDAFAC